MPKSEVGNAEIRIHSFIAAQRYTERMRAGGVKRERELEPVLPPWRKPMAREVGTPPVDTRVPKAEKDNQLFCT